MRAPHWIGLSLLAACAGASDEKTGDHAATASAQGASSHCADAGLSTIGAQDGDRLVQINGFDVADPDAALAAFNRLRTASELTVQRERRGCPTTLQIDIK